MRRTCTTHSYDLVRGETIKVLCGLHFVPAATNCALGPARRSSRVRANIWGTIAAYPRVSFCCLWVVQLCEVTSLFQVLIEPRFLHFTPHLLALFCGRQANFQTSNLRSVFAQALLSDTSPPLCPGKLCVSSRTSTNFLSAFNLRRICNRCSDVDSRSSMMSTLRTLSEQRHPSLSNDMHPTRCCLHQQLHHSAESQKLCIISCGYILPSQPTSHDSCLPEVSRTAWTESLVARHPDFPVPKRHRKYS